MNGISAKLENDKLVELNFFLMMTPKGTAFPIDVWFV